MSSGRKLWLGFGLGGAAVALVLVFAVFEVQTAFYDVTVDEPFEAPASGAVLTGSFHGVEHAVRGRAAVYDVAGGGVLRLEGFRVDNGPTLRVLVVAAADATDSAAVKSSETVDVGELKGNVGDQSYPLPAGFDRQRHRAVTIWCERFGVNFATAPLR